MKDVIQKRLEEYDCKTAQEEENAINEITQEVVLYGLSKSGYFERAEFHGGTSLRIVHGLDRFSEDLDFALRKKDEEFDLQPYLEEAVETMRSYGYNTEISGKETAETNVRKRFLKDDSIKKLLTFEHYRDTRKKIRIKIEVDINPPDGATSEQAFLDFPIDFSLSTHDLSSLFAGKCHALLCRQYTKGRDWYDLTWYLSKKIKPNYALLTSALVQNGPWQGQKLDVHKEWLREMLSQKIRTIDWKAAVAEVSRFLKPNRAEALSLWGEEFFLKKIDKLKQ